MKICSKCKKDLPRRRKIVRPRPMRIYGEEFVAIAESKMGGEFVRIKGSLLPASDISRMMKKMRECLIYLKAIKSIGKDGGK